MGKHPFPASFVRDFVYVSPDVVIRDPNSDLLKSQLPKREIKNPGVYTKEEKEQMDKEDYAMQEKYNKVAHPERDADSKAAPALSAELVRLLDEKIQSAIKEERSKKKNQSSDQWIRHVFESYVLNLCRH